MKMGIMDRNARGRPREIEGSKLGLKIVKMICKNLCGDLKDQPGSEMTI